MMYLPPAAGQTRRRDVPLCSLLARAANERPLWVIANARKIDRRSILNQVLNLVKS
jgi:hypothetical protein